MPGTEIVSQITNGEPDEEFCGTEPDRLLLLYSPDIDFCLTFRMLFQDRYSIATVTDVSMLAERVHSLEPKLLIADTFPTETMKQRFRAMKKEHPGLRIMLFYASPMDEHRLREEIREFVDAAFNKPIDLTEISHTILRLMTAGEEISR